MLRRRSFGAAAELTSSWIALQTTDPGHELLFSAKFQAAAVHSLTVWVVRTS
jgi:hypothetical protein